jgi:radical SAM-linked protein
MRVLSQAFVRAGIPVSLTQGFRPHPRFSLALALPLGASSEAEYADVELERTVDAMEAARQLNRVLPPGIRVKQVQEVPVGTPPLQSQVAAARWLLEMELVAPPDSPAVQDALSRLLEQPHLPLVREKGEKVRTVDARPLILAAQVRAAPEGEVGEQTEAACGSGSDGGGQVVRVEAVLAAGSSSLRAAEFARLLAEAGGWELRRLRIHLLQLYALRDGVLVDPARLGEEAWRDYHRKAGF